MKLKEMLASRVAQQQANKAKVCSSKLVCSAQSLMFVSACVELVIMLAWLLPCCMCSQVP